MVTYNYFDKDLFGDEKRGVDTSYWGASALHADVPEHIHERIVKYLYKDCVVDQKHEGIIIGFEDNNQCFDYYYIVYIPSLNKVTYQLCNNAEFVKSIKV